MTATPRQYATAWYELLSGAPKREWKAITGSVLRWLHQQGEISLVPEILRAMEDIETARTGEISVTITGARSMGEGEMKKLVVTITGEASARITHKKNEHLLGGIRIETKNKRWDLSAQGALTQLRKRIV